MPDHIVHPRYRPAPRPVGRKTILAALGTVGGLLAWLWIADHGLATVAVPAVAGLLAGAMWIRRRR